MIMHIRYHRFKNIKSVINTYLKIHTVFCIVKLAFVVPGDTFITKRYKIIVTDILVQAITLSAMERKGL